MEMSDLVLKSTGFILKFLENLYKDKVTVTGVENIPGNPTLFVCNHFTRAETLILPYFIHKHTGKMARSLADKVVFVGALGDYLRKTGTLSTEDPNRNEIIVGDLLTGEHNWLIYPEGNMMKNKKVTRKGKRFQLHLKDKTRDLYTGSAVLALRAELLREDYFKNRNKTNLEKYFVDDNKIIRRDATCIVPISITYYPIRPYHSKIQEIAKKFVKKTSPRFEEEITMEGYILGNSDIHIHFEEPIYVDRAIAGSKFIRKATEILPAETRHDMAIKQYRHKLTTAFMEKIYSSITLNVDHIFALTLYHHPEQTIHIKELKVRIYDNIRELQKNPHIKMHPNLHVDAFKLIIGRNFEPWKSIMELAEAQGVIIGGSQVEYLQINRSALENEHEFHNIRLKNMLRVFVNEASIIPTVVDVVKENAQRSFAEIGEEIAEILHQKDVEIFEQDYKKYKSEHSKPPEIGRPFFLRAQIDGKPSKKGIVLCHGYKAAPEEIRQLAEYLNGHGYNVYGVRLDGHGTSPENMLTTSWIKWYDSYMRGYASLQSACDEVIFAGFSTGGLISLYAAAKNPSKCSAVISINAALKLQDIRMRIVKTVNFWNELVSKFGKKSKLEYIVDEPENPHINYSINYVKGVNQLQKLMEKTKENLPKIFSPTLIVQSPKDPIINPKSGKLIFEEIHSRKKELLQPEVTKHVIVRGDVETKVFSPILEFINKL